MVEETEMYTEFVGKSYRMMLLIYKNGGIVIQ